ncbi:MAG: amidohydrolase family protein [Candidatus Latescibacterota bacterium]|nr:amidohydrolase family protein [Candidatus Latescibacterota bacterium]
MKIIDSHQHVHYHGLGPKEVVAEMDAFGIERTWVLTWYLPAVEDVPASHGTFNPSNFRPDGTHAGSTLDDVLEACRDYPDRFVPGFCPCPSEGSAAARFEAAYHMHDVRVCGEWSYRMLLDDPRAVELFRKAGELGCPVVLHMDVPFLPDGEGGHHYEEFWYGGGMGPLERALQACPDTVFIGHAPGFWRSISGDEATDPAKYPQGPVTSGGELLRLLYAYGNLWADLSAGSGLGAMRRDLGHAREFLSQYADRLLFGRDAPGDELRQFLLGLDISDEVKRKIFCDNALRLVFESARG